MAPSMSKILPQLPEEVWRLIVQHGVTKVVTYQPCGFDSNVEPETRSDYRISVEECYHSDQLNDQLLYDPTTQFKHQRQARDYPAMLNLSQTCRFFHDLVADELYQHIALCGAHGIVREQFTLLLRTLAERPKIRDRVKHITIVPWFNGSVDRESPDLDATASQLMGRGARGVDYLPASTFLNEEDIKKMDRQARAIIDTAGLELANLPINRMQKQSTAEWLERALAALVCLSSGLRSLSIQEPLPSCYWEPAWMPAWDVDGFERVIRNIRNLPISGGNILQELEAVSVSTCRSKNVSKEAFTVYASPRLTGFQAVGFLSMKDWHRLVDFRSTLVHLDIGHLYPQLSNMRWVGLNQPNPRLAREAAEFRRILSTFNRLKFLRVSYALLIGQLEEKTKGFGDMISALLPPSIEHFQIAVFNHGTDIRVERPNIDMSVKCFFEGLGSWRWELEQEGYWLKFHATHRGLRDFGILVHQKGNSRNQHEFWLTKRTVNMTRLHTWLVEAGNYMDPSDGYYNYFHAFGYIDEDRLDEDDEPGNSYDGYCPRGTLQALHAQFKQLGVNFQVSTFQPPMFHDNDSVGYGEGYVQQVIPYRPIRNAPWSAMPTSQVAKPSSSNQANTSNQIGAPLKSTNQL